MEAYRQELAHYAQAPRRPQLESDVEAFLIALQTPEDIIYQGQHPTANWISSAYNDVNMYYDMEMGVGQGGFLDQQWRNTYGQLFQLAAQQILEFLDNPVPEEETFPGPMPVPQPYGSGVRQRKRRGFMGALDELIRGLGLKAVSCSCGCDECGGCMCGGSATKRQQFLKAHKLPDKSYSLKELSSISKVPLQTLQEVYNRGIGAYKTNPESVRLKGSFVKGVKAPMSAKLSKEQWAMSRVYSFLTGNPTHDQDLREDKGGKRVTFARKYLRGRGIRATKGNIRKVLDSMDVEGVVFEG